MNAALGIDTSCYTTSLALADANGVLNSKRKLLSVAEGERGLRQSDAAFQHTQALPILLSELLGETSAVISGVCVSAKPRGAEGSYMPVFKAGAALASVISSVLNVPYIETDHQRGHVRAAMEGSGMPGGDFIALHLSGGTTEALRVCGDLDIELLGGSSDICAGQLIDRIGVKLGLRFPAGAELEKLALTGEAKSLMPLSAKRLSVSFSGAEAQAMRMIDIGDVSANDIAAEVFSYIARAVVRLIIDAYAETGLEMALISGGVASSTLLRELIIKRLRRERCPVKAYFGKPELSGDNACGVALIGAEKLFGR